MQVIDHSCFQRLRNVRQLGLANLVYPSADYSRFSHSLGAMNAMGELMTALLHKHDEFVTPTVVQVFRLVALLHDIGHYPLSHLYEDAIIRHTGLKKDAIFNHERAGAHLIETRLAKLLDSSQLSHEFREELEHRSLEQISLSEFVAKVIRHQASESMRYGVYGVLDKLLSGSVDCDRLDYLLRTSTGSSLPYGIVDLDYLVHNVKLQETPLNVVFSRKAQHAATHMLESRVYDYLTTSYHKTVKALELELMDSIRESFAKNELPFEEAALQDLMKDDEWVAFDDGSLRLTLLNSSSPAAKSIASRVFGRAPRKTLYSRTLELSKKRWEDFGGYKTFRSRLHSRLAAGKPEGVPEGIWFVQAVEALDASDASTFAEMESASVPDDTDLQIFSQVSKLRDRVTLVLHFYLASQQLTPPNYKTAFEQTLDDFLQTSLRETAEEVKKLSA